MLYFDFESMKTETSYTCDAEELREQLHFLSQEWDNLVGSWQQNK